MRLLLLIKIICSHVSAASKVTHIQTLVISASLYTLLVVSWLIFDVLDIHGRCRSLLAQDVLEVVALRSSLLDWDLISQESFLHLDGIIVLLMLFFAISAGSKPPSLPVEHQLSLARVLLTEDLATDLTVMPSEEKVEFFLALIAIVSLLVRNHLLLFLGLVDISLRVDHLLAQVMAARLKRVLIDAHINHRFTVDRKILVEVSTRLDVSILLVLDGDRVVLSTTKLLHYRLIDQL